MSIREKLILYKIDSLFLRDVNQPPRTGIRIAPLQEKCKRKESKPMRCIAHEMRYEDRNNSIYNTLIFHLSSAFPTVCVNTFH